MNCDWFTALFARVVIGRSNCFGFVENRSNENDWFQLLESLLPTRPKQVQPGEDAEEVDLMDLDPRYHQQRRGNGFEDGSDDENGHGPRVQCAHQ